MLLRTAILLALAFATARAEGLTRLRFNHPGLTVDLGVGLWAWPVSRCGVGAVSVFESRSRIFARSQG